MLNPKTFTILPEQKLYLLYEHLKITLWALTQKFCNLMPYFLWEMKCMRYKNNLKISIERIVLSI